MTIQYRQAPTYQIPIADGQNTHRSWYRWFQDIDKGTPPSQEIAVTVTKSPFTFIAPSKGALMVNGGTVSVVQFTRMSTYVTGQTSGMFSLSANDKLTITYSGVPTVTFIPQ